MLPAALNMDSTGTLVMRKSELDHTGPGPCVNVRVSAGLLDCSMQAKLVLSSNTIYCPHYIDNSGRRKF